MELLAEHKGGEAQAAVKNISYRFPNSKENRRLVFLKNQLPELREGKNRLKLPSLPKKRLKGADIQN